MHCCYLFHPWINLLVWRVNQIVSLLILFNESLHSENKKVIEWSYDLFVLRFNWLAERPPLHLGLEPHVVDLEGEAVSVHGSDQCGCDVCCKSDVRVVLVLVQPSGLCAAASLGSQRPSCCCCWWESFPFSLSSCTQYMVRVPMMSHTQHTL